MDSITTAINKAIIDYTNNLISNGYLTCSLDQAITLFDSKPIKSKPTSKSVSKKKNNDLIKSLPMWTPHHFDTCIALVGDCMAQCSLSKTQGQFCTACSKKCGDDGIPPNGTIFTRTTFDYVAPNGKSPKPFIESTIYKKKIKEGDSHTEIQAYYESLQFDISPLNWIPSKKSSKSDSNDSSIQKSIESSTDEKSNKKAEDDSHHISNNDQHLTCELPDGAYSWSHSGIDYLAVDFPNGDKNIFDSNSFEHIGIFNSKAKRLIRY